MFHHHGPFLPYLLTATSRIEGLRVSKVAYRSWIWRNTPIGSAKIKRTYTDICQILIRAHIDHDNPARRIQHVIYHTIHLYLAIHDLVHSQFPWILLIGLDTQIKWLGQIKPCIGRVRKTIQGSEIMKGEFILIIATCGIQYKCRVARIQNKTCQLQPRHIHGIIHIKCHRTCCTVNIHTRGHRTVFRGTKPLCHDLADRPFHQRIGYIILYSTRGQPEQASQTNRTQILFTHQVLYLHSILNSLIGRRSYRY